LHQNLQYRLNRLQTARTVRTAPGDGPPGTAGQSGPLGGQSILPFFQLDIFRDKDLNMNLLGSLLKNNEGILPYDAM
jgi:hypothetical protein